jgi:hypothetical protein
MDEDNGVREQKLTIGNGVPVAGGWLAVGEAAEVVLCDEEKVRSVSQRGTGTGITWHRAHGREDIHGGATVMRRRYGAPKVKRRIR